jgi:2-keto-4-pentenoate hydratase/2-oxohepta-3-ene-1,7-dioic acid hydratase in catechol pathway
VWGYTAANDVTAREQQKSDAQWTRGKGHDTFCPLGPWIETDLDPSDLRVRCEVDEVLRQDGRTRDLHPRRAVGAGVHHVVHDAAARATSCSPARPPASAARAGQHGRVEVEGVGTLRNPVVAR